MKSEKLTSQIIGLCMKVHSALGPGLLESVYEEALCIELIKANINFSRQKAVNVTYEGADVGKGFRYDLLIEEELLMELKSVDAVAPVHLRTALTYMRFTLIEVGLLINFNVAHLRDGITRLVLDKPVKIEK
jgi:GxxExxY protein